MPPGDIASQYYPLLDPYSSSDETVIESHLKWLLSAGIDVLSVSWYPSGMADEQGKKILFFKFNLLKIQVNRGII